MKKQKGTYWLWLILVGMLTSCGEPEALQAIEEQTEREALLKDYQSAMDAQRGTKPRTSKGQVDVTENYGEKGHDRRDLAENEEFRIGYLDPLAELKIGDLYVVNKDNDTDYYNFRFYFGDDINATWYHHSYLTLRVWLKNGSHPYFYQDSFFSLGNLYCFHKSYLKQIIRFDYYFYKPDCGRGAAMGFTLDIEDLIMINEE